MYARNGRIWAVALFASFILPLSCLGQQETASPNKGLTPAQEAHRRYEAKHRLQAQAKQVFDVEMSREKAGDCPDAKSTYDFNVCYGKELTITDQNLKSFEGFIRELIDAPLLPGQPTVESNDPANGIAGPSLSSQEFDRVEQSWAQYRESACSAALHQFEGGTGGPSFQMECQLKLARDHMRELNMIYGEELHL
jgi:uncharacterized protein YecT (DUF1311 family)